MFYAMRHSLTLSYVSLKYDFILLKNRKSLDWLPMFHFMHQKLYFTWWGHFIDWCSPKLNCSYCINWDLIKIGSAHLHLLCELILYLCCICSVFLLNLCCICIVFSLYLHGCVYCVNWEIRGSIVNATDSSWASQSEQWFCQTVIGPQMIDFDWPLIHLSSIRKLTRINKEPKLNQWLP